MGLEFDLGRRIFVEHEMAKFMRDDDPLFGLIEATCHLDRAVGPIKRTEYFGSIGDALVEHADFEIVRRERSGDERFTPTVAVRFLNGDNVVGARLSPNVDPGVAHVFSSSQYRICSGVIPLLLIISSHVRCLIVGTARAFARPMRGARRVRWWAASKRTRVTPKARRTADESLFESGPSIRPL